MKKESCRKIYKIDGYRYEIGQIKKNGKSCFINLGFWLIPNNSEITHRTLFNSINSKIKQLMYEASQNGLKSIINANMPYFVDVQIVDETTLKKLMNIKTFCSIEVTLFFKDNQNWLNNDLFLIDVPKLCADMYDIVSQNQYITIYTSRKQ